MSRSGPTTLSRWLWFIWLWAMSVALLAAVAFSLRWILALSGAAR